MTELTTAINNIDKPLFNRIRAKVAGKSKGAKSEKDIENAVEKAIIEQLNKWAIPEK